MEGKEFFVNNKDDEEEEARVVAEATVEVLKRTGSAGFPLLCGNTGLRAIEKGLKRAGARALVYHYSSNESCSEIKVEEWLRRRRNGKEERVLIADEDVSRGWECSHVLVVDLTGMQDSGLENLVMRTVGYCALVKLAPK